MLKISKKFHEAFAAFVSEFAAFVRMELFMKVKLNVKSAILGTAVVCAAVLFVAAFSGANAQENPYAPADENKIEQAAADTKNACEARQFIDFRKAGITEYDMTVAQSAASGEKKSSKNSVGSFSVELPEDSTKIYDPQPSALGYTQTRSVADEYYTVYDIISGKTVTLNAHEMLCRIVYSEIGATWREDAIKAQIVAAYSYLRFNDANGLIPTVGLKSGYPSKIERCVSQVEGQCVYYKGNIINAVYSASSAGCSAQSEKVWGGKYPYLRAVRSEFDSQDPNYGEKNEFTEDEIKAIFKKRTDIKLSDNVKEWFKIQTLSSEKYVGRMSIDGHETCKVDGSTVRLTGFTVQKLLALKSNAFTVDYKDGVFTFTTYGYGHGVGMSQWGACLYAKNGYKYDQILRHYYLNTTIKVSSANKKAVERGKKTQEELDEEISNSTITDDSQSIPVSGEVIENGTEFEISDKNDEASDVQKPEDTENSSETDSSDAEADTDIQPEEPDNAADDSSADSSEQTDESSADEIVGVDEVVNGQLPDESSQE